MARKCPIHDIDMVEGKHYSYEFEESMEFGIEYHCSKCEEDWVYDTASQELLSKSEFIQKRFR